jgi:hypothetical protein
LGRTNKFAQAASILVCTQMMGGSGWAADPAPWVEVTLKDKPVFDGDPNGIWTRNELKRATWVASADVRVGKATVPGGEVLVSRLQEIGCNAECPTRVVLRRPGQEDVLLFDDYARFGTMAGSGRDAPMVYRVRSDLSELDAGAPGWNGQQPAAQATDPGGAEPQGPVKLDRSGLR